MNNFKIPILNTKLKKSPTIGMQHQESIKKGPSDVTNSCTCTAIGLLNEYIHVEPHLVASIEHPPLRCN